MPIITAYSRLQHHSLSGLGETFSVPLQEDFTISGTQAWTKYDLCNSEIGINTTDKRLYFRTDSTINELFNVQNVGTGLTYSGGVLSAIGGTGGSSYVFYTEDVPGLTAGIYIPGPVYNVSTKYDANSGSESIMTKIENPTTNEYARLRMEESLVEMGYDDGTGNTFSYVNTNPALIKMWAATPNGTNNRLYLDAAAGYTVLDVWNSAIGFSDNLQETRYYNAYQQLVVNATTGFDSYFYLDPTNSLGNTNRLGTIDNNTGQNSYYFFDTTKLEMRWTDGSSSFNEFTMNGTSAFQKMRIGDGSTFKGEMKMGSGESYLYHQDLFNGYTHQVYLDGTQSRLGSLTVAEVIVENGPTNPGVVRLQSWADLANDCYFNLDPQGVGYGNRWFMGSTKYADIQLEAQRITERVWNGAYYGSYILKEDSKMTFYSGWDGTGFSDYSESIWGQTYQQHSVYDNATSTNVASILLENQGPSEGHGVINIIGTAYQSIFNLDPSGINGGTYWKQLSTTSSNETYISLTDTTLYQTVYDATAAASSWINMNYGSIEITTDSDTTHFNLSSTGGVLTLNIIGLPATASNPGDVWVDTNGFLRIV